MAQYIDDDDVAAVMKTGVRDALYTDTVNGSVNSAALTLSYKMASHVARNAANNAGYGLDDDDTPGNASISVKFLTLTVWLRMAFGRGGESPPEDLLNLVQGFLEATWVGDIPLVDEALDEVIGVGGITSTEADDPEVDGAILTVTTGLEDLV
ncbi:MAG: hypothetical protein ACPGVG_15200 [Mycobacterium sp.]